MMAILDVTNRVPPMPSICSGLGVLMRHFSTRSLKGPGAGISTSLRKSALFDSLRMYTPGMDIWLVDIVKW